VTAEEKVKAKWPDALAYKHPQADLWVIGLQEPAGTNLSGCFSFEALAWEDAANSIGPDRGGER